MTGHSLPVDNHEISPDPVYSEERQQPRLSLPLRLRMGETAKLISGIAVTSALIMAGAIGTNESPSQATPLTTRGNVPTLEEAHYRPVTDFEFEKDDEEALDDAVEQADAGIGNVFDVVKPRQESLDAYHSYFNVPPYIEIPRLSEVIHVRDHNIFSGELEEHPHKYPFNVYNATEKPVDITYLDYALRAVRYWLNANESSDSLLLDDAYLIDVRPRLALHSMIMVKNFHDYREGGGSYRTDGFTTWGNGINKSLILEDGPSREPFLNETIATEMCQSMVAVGDVRPIPGGKLSEKHLNDVVYSFNDTARPDNIRQLAPQESVCNMLGNIVAAAYQGGRPAVERLLNKPSNPDSLPPTPWLDYGLAAPEAAKFLWLARHVPLQWNTIITGRHDHTPTDNYYREHHHIPGI